MPLIPCLTGTYAIYTQPDGSRVAVPVEAWGDPEGTPFVAGETHLTAAHSRTGFAGLERSDVVLPPPSETPKEPTRVRPTQRRGRGEERQR
jgi:hypothetical protein